MKIGKDLYQCNFCNRQIVQPVKKVSGQGKKGTSSDQVKCVCGNYTSQE